MIGQLRERLTIQTNNPVAIRVTSLTRAGSTATASTAPRVHGFASNDYVTVAGAVQSEYNIKAKATVTSPTAFTFQVGGSPSTGTGSITVIYTSNAQGGRRADVWRDLATVPAEMIPLKAYERLQLAAIQSDTTYRFRVRSRADLAVTQRLAWTPRWPAGASQQALTVTGVLPDPGDPNLVYMLIDAAVA